MVNKGQRLTTQYLVFKNKLKIHNPVMTNVQWYFGDTVYKNGTKMCAILDERITSFSPRQTQSAEFDNTKKYIKRIGHMFG